jgi:sorbitol-specific phosphotransferase system component IIC
VAAGFLGTVIPALVLLLVILAILVAVIAAEAVTGARRRARGEPSPLEALR